MGLISNVRRNYQAMRVGKTIMGEGYGFKAPSGGGSVLSELARMLQPRYTEPPQRDIVDWLKLFADSPRLDPVHKIAEDVASSDWGFFKQNKDGEKEKVEDHPLIPVFQKPNPLPESTWFNLLYMTEAYLQIAGEAFWIIERSGLNQINEFWMIPPNWVRTVPTQNDDSFEIVTFDGVTLRIPSEDVVYFKEPNMLNPYGRGRGRAKAIEDEVETDEYMAKWAKKFFYNDAKPPFVIEAPGASKPDVERMQESWMQRFGGINNAHKPAVLPFAGKLHELGTNAKEMDFVASRKFLRDQTNQHFRVPPELMGIIENSNRATIDAADYIYRSSVLINRLTMIQQAVQHQILNRFFPNDEILFEFENVIPQDKEFELKVANEGIKNGALTINEWRQKNGYDPLEGDDGDVFLIPNTYVPVRKPINAQMFGPHVGSTPPSQQPPNGGPNGGAPKPDDTQQPEEPQAPKEPEAPKDDAEKMLKIKSLHLKDKKEDLTPEQIANIKDVFDSKMDELEKKHAKAIHKFMRDQGRKFAKHVEGLDIKEMVEIFETKADANDINGDGIDDILQQADNIMDNYDWVDEQTQLHKLMGPQMLEAAQAGNAIVNGLFELGVSFSLLRPEMLNYINTIGLQKVVGITATTINLLKTTLIEGIKNGEGSAKLAKRIREASEEYSYSRSFVIARTESHNTMVKGTDMSYKEGQVPKKQWMTIMDGRERTSHHKIHLEKVNSDEKFSNGLMHPGDPEGAANEVIQCRCQLLPAWS
jgi:HK97 family phage portal protein